ncbi:MAG: GatB/YqeY domain-containing protein [Betaproteobacteria bacterium]|nr:MAG: GatB/YqeY domain-containing protein [Betaproteobacteria bacterium]
MSLKARINDDMKSAMRAKEADRLKAIRLLLAAIKQREVDERVELTDADVLGVIDKMLKQRRESIAQFEQAGRIDLADAEKAEVAVLQVYMPQPMSAAEIEALVDVAIQAVNAQTPRDMGTVMAQLRPQLAGRADMAQVSQLVKARLSR